MRRIITLLLALLTSAAAFAGGPITVGGNFGVSGKPFTWDNTKPIQYWVDGGSLGKLTHAEAVQRIDSLFNVWGSIPTANLTFKNAGAIPAMAGFTDGDVSTLAELDAVLSACQDTSSSTNMSPIVFDSDGSIMSDLGADSDVLGFQAVCKYGADGHLHSGVIVVNGAVYSGRSDDLTSDELDSTIEHEFGHFLGLDHSQINMACINSRQCSAADINGIPTMFPWNFVQSGGFQKSLSADDIAWISYLYPVEVATSGKTLFKSTYSIISGNVLFADGITPAQGINVVAYQMSNGIADHANAFSVVSGFLFTGNPGQTVTGTNISSFTGLPGSDFGSRDPLLIGHYEIPVPAGYSYSVQIESIDRAFVDGSSVGPQGRYSPEGRGANIPMPGLTVVIGPISVSVGTPSPNNDIKMAPTPPRFDSYESSDVGGQA